MSEDEKNCESDSPNLSWLTTQPSGSQNADLTNVLAQLVGAASAESNADPKQAEFLKLLAGGSLSQDSSVTYVKVILVFVFCKYVLNSAMIYLERTLKRCPLICLVK